MCFTIHTCNMCSAQRANYWQDSTLEWGYIVLNMGCGDFTLDYLFLLLSPHIPKNHYDAISVVVVASPKYLAQLVAMIQPMVMLPHMHKANS